MITLLYQVGIANVFDGDKRVMQNAYSPCEWYVRGRVAEGAELRVMHWDGAGDAALFRNEWHDGAGDLWSDQKAFTERDEDEVMAYEWDEDWLTYQREIAL